MSRPGVTHETFAKALSRLTEFVLLGKTHLKIGRGIQALVLTDPVLARTAPVFWGMTLTAHLDIAQIVAFKLFDTQRGTMTIEYLLDCAFASSASFQKATPLEVDAIVSASRSKLASIAAFLVPLRAKRNRVLAHSDPTIIHDPERLSKECAVTFAGLDSIFAVAGDVLNSINVAYSDTSSWMEIFGETDYEVVVQLIVDAKHALVDKYEAEFGSPPDFDRPKQNKSPW